MKLKITVHGVAYEVDVEVLDDDMGGFTGSPLPVMNNGIAPQGAPAQSGAGAAPMPPKPKAKGPAAGGGSGSVTSPIAGTVLEIQCKVGDELKEGDIVMILEAMKMKTSIAAPADGKVKAIPVEKTENIREGQTLIEFE
jgi:biotin carboxyl carrier protein